MEAWTRGWARIAVLGFLMALAPALAAPLDEEQPMPWAPMGELRDPISGHFCCDHQDCRPLDDSRVRPVDGGYRLWNGEFIPQRRVIRPAAGWEHDGRYWRCVYLDGPHKGKTRCFVAPDRFM